MSIAQAIPSSPRLSVPADEVPGQDRSSAARSPKAVEAPGLPEGGASSIARRWILGAGSGSGSTASWLVSPSAARPGAGAGYATAASAAASASKSKAPAGPKITGEWSFLTDASLSVEEKLARFMAAVQKKLDGELTQKMEDYKAKYGEGGTEAKQKDDGGGIFGTILKVLVPPLAIADSIFGGVDEFLKDALQALGGPVLAALATAVGLPMLAPAALALGQGLGAMVAGDSSTSKKAPAKKTETKSDSKTDASKEKTPAKGTTAAKPKADKKTETGEAGSPDERLQMLEIQRLVDKQNQMFTLVSNIMKSMHDTSMVAVQNLR
jgi:hypothetical protein